MISTIRVSRPLSITLISFILSGCITTDIIKEGNLPDNYKQIAIEMRLRTENQCTTHTYDPTSGNKLTGDTKIATKVSVRRFYLSDAGWFKAETNGNGVIDNVFYSPSTGRFICGQRTWDTFTDTKSIVFREHGSSEKTIGVSQQSLTTLSHASNLTRPSTIRSIAVSWEGYSKLISGTIDLSPNASNPGSFKISLPNNDGQCSGQTKQIDRRTGVWSISCTNGMSAAGTFEAYGDGKGASGTGTDSKGKEVRYTISGTN